jgi:hypothetical protein
MAYLIKVSPGCKNGRTLFSVLFSQLERAYVPSYAARSSVRALLQYDAYRTRSAVRFLVIDQIGRPMIDLISSPGPGRVARRSTWPSYSFRLSRLQIELTCCSCAAGLKLPSSPIPPDTEGEEDSVLSLELLRDSTQNPTVNLHVLTAAHPWPLLGFSVNLKKLHCSFWFVLG